MGVLKKLTDEYFEKAVREEDRFDSNIKEMKEVNIDDSVPVLFADRDLVVDGHEYFDFYELCDMLPKIEKRGWTLPDRYDFDNWFYAIRGPWEPHDYIKSKFVQYKGGVITGKKTNEKLVFNTDKQYGEDYWCYPQEWPKTAPGFGMGDNGFPVCVKTNNFPKDEQCKIRLVKYKEKK